MDKIKLDVREINILIKEIELFAAKEYNLELNDNQASGLIDFVLSKTEARIYNQVSFETRISMQQNLAHLLGIKDPPLH